MYKFLLNSWPSPNMSNSPNSWTYNADITTNIMYTPSEWDPPNTWYHNYITNIRYIYSKSIGIICIYIYIHVYMLLHSVTLYHLHTIYISYRYRVTNFWILPDPNSALCTSTSGRRCSRCSSKSRNSSRSFGSCSTVTVCHKPKKCGKKTPGEIENNVEIYRITE